ncbi:MAG: transporter substrate-binding domain-containing protein [Marinifilaceae bacterium]|jgi:membrane-bound lytic murein transglycosylase F|nr:transporter substrate-binding domain-containing protein [Marinifilaceae bacterium]
MNKFTLYLLLIIITLSSCYKVKDKQKEDFYSILTKPSINVIMEYNSIDYFIYKGSPMGFQYELVKRFAKDIGVKVNIKISNDIENIYSEISNGDADIIACPLGKNEYREKLFHFSVPIDKTSIVLIQRKQTNTNDFISNINDLKGKKVFVISKSTNEDVLKKLNKENNLDLDIVSIKNFSTEELIDMVAHKEISYTVSDENIAYTNNLRFKNIDKTIILQVEQNLYWGVNKEKNELLHDLNKWLETFVDSYDYRILYNKYYNSRQAKKMYTSPFFYLNTRKISKYDDIIKLKSKKINWDWKLLASMIYQESNFNPEVTSWAGAHGLMQIMPNTADMVKIDSIDTVEGNLEAGVRYIKYLNKQLKKALRDTTDIIPFILASYNVGLGHVLDARRLARKYGKNPDKWFQNTDFYILNKSQPLYYKDNLSRYGYCNGQEPYKYVEDILDRYKQYKNMIQN